MFNRPTDVTWDSDGNIFVSDGYNNSRLAKFDKNGNWVKAQSASAAARPTSSTRRTASRRTPRVTSTWPTAATAAFRSTTPDLKRQRIIEGMGAPWSLCVSPGRHAVPVQGDGNGKIYKFDLDGKLRGLGADLA